MASSQTTVDYITEQMESAGIVTSRKMFGDYAIYCNGKVIGFVCDDSLFIKPTKEGKEWYPEAEDAPPYPGAKMYMRISEEKWDDREFMTQLVSITYQSLPIPKSRKKKSE